ncbi:MULTISPECIES: urease accessory UreF family protein [unclassified Brevibacterium]|uniref:urease accessory UreF family protein n=1 Tax=unclassified Brevibacterium TaxID=2614124 RepID=UPI001BB19036|nr:MULTISPECIES: urease accessory UreF family protein [unclassified Brevibacterium]MCM1011256.1 urease accessory protein UreF [Brevibacterium sp. XM4083]
MDTVTLNALGPGAASAIIMLLADARLPAGAHVTSNGVEAGLRHGLVTGEVAAYMRARMRTVVRVEAGTAVVTRHALTDTRVVDGDEVDRGSRSDRESSAILADIGDEWAARTPSPALREIAEALGAGLRRVAVTLWPKLNPVMPRRGLPRPVVLGSIAAAAGIPAADLVRLVAYDDAQTVAAAMLKLEPMDPLAATGWVLEACTAFEPCVADLATLTDPAAIPAAGAPLIEDWAEAQSALPRRLFRA